MTHRYPVIGQSATIATALRAAAALVESSGITGLLIACSEHSISVQVCSDTGDARHRAGLVARLAALIGTSPVRVDSHHSRHAWIQAYGSVAGLPVDIYTTINIQHLDDHQLAADPHGRIALAATPDLPPGWRWLTELDQPAEPQASSPTPQPGSTPPEVTP